ncbi:MAG: 50S ribosomal protein L19 [Chthoniobacteraceae bacterium]
MNRGQILRNIESEQLKKVTPKFNVGDTVKVHTIVREGVDKEGKSKERIQIFTGVVIARKGTLVNASFTVRRISYGEGVERVFPLHSPRISKVEVEREGAPRRAKLYYLRDRKGKEATYVKPKNTALAKTERATLRKATRAAAAAEAPAAAVAAE